MFGLNLFIAGIEKCGTTSLANWLVSNGLAEYRVPGIKDTLFLRYRRGFSKPRPDPTRRTA